MLEESLTELFATAPSTPRSKSKLCFPILIFGVPFTISIDLPRERFSDPPSFSPTCSLQPHQEMGENRKKRKCDILWSHEHITKRGARQRDTSSCALSKSCCLCSYLGWPSWFLCPALPILAGSNVLGCFQMPLASIYSIARSKNKIRGRDTHGWSWHGLGSASENHCNWDKFAQIPLHLPSSHTYACSDKTLAPETFRPRMWWQIGQNSHERFCLWINWDLATSSFPSKLLEHFTCKL